MDLDELLTRYKLGELDIDAVKQQLTQLPYEELNFAKLDHHRRLRTGYGEVVYCSGKVTEHLVEIFKHLAANGSDVLGSRASLEQYEAVHAVFPETTYDPVSRILILRQHEKSTQQSSATQTDCTQQAPTTQPNSAPQTHTQQSGSVPQSFAKQSTPAFQTDDSSPGIGNICICTAGTADVPVAEEAAQTAEFFGNHVTRIYDVGVAGIHRLLSNLDRIRQSTCVIAVAGMEGALPGVVAGLVQVPVIGVPTSIGYGTGYQGAAAILTMLNSCSNGIATVNIDNGFGAAYLASQINHQTVEGPGQK